MERRSKLGTLALLIGIAAAVIGGFFMGSRGKVAIHEARLDKHDDEIARHSRELAAHAAEIAAHARKIAAHDALIAEVQKAATDALARTVAAEQQGKAARDDVEQLKAEIAERDEVIEKILERLERLERVVGAQQRP